jgi:1-acyl-sn-glycerol-3-phosphate acyltransferase
MNTHSLWQPRSMCDTSCLPRDGTTPAVSIVGQFGRWLAILAILVVAALLLPALPLMSARQRLALVRRWARALLRGMGVRHVVRGRLPVRRALLVANHISWLDVLVLLAASPDGPALRLLAKHEVRGWPVIGWLGMAAGTIFIDRASPRHLPVTVSAVAGALRQDGVVAVFPEGTTWCGTAGGRFRPAMFQAAIDAGAVIAPVTLTFRLADGRRTTAAAFLGADTLWASVRRVLRVRGLVVAATAAPAVHPDASATRGALARIAEAAVGMDYAVLDTDYTSLNLHNSAIAPVSDKGVDTPLPATGLGLAA